LNGDIEFHNIADVNHGVAGKLAETGATAGRLRSAGKGQSLPIKRKIQYLCGVIDKQFEIRDEIVTI
jgi:hypothetical protein